MAPKSPKTVAELYEDLIRTWGKTPFKTLADLHAAYETLSEQAKGLYDKKDATLKKLVRAWKKNKSARVDAQHVLEIEDAFRGQVKAFAPGFAHRYKLKLKTVQEAE